VVHRLDLGTSGVLLFSLTPQAHRALRQAWSDRAVLKEYSAIVLGWPHPRRGLIDLPLRRNASGRMAPDPRGLPAKTRYATLRRYFGSAWVSLQPLTGRMHQLRVHLAARQTPILGDRVYGPRLAPGLPRPPRLCLHAGRLVLPASLVEELQPRPQQAEAETNTAADPSGAWVLSAREPQDLEAYRARLASIDRKGSSDV